MRFKLNIFHVVIITGLLFYGYYLLQPDAFSDEQHGTIDLGPYPTAASPILLPNQPTITIIIKPYCPTLTPLADDATFSEERLRLYTRCRAGDWVYMSPTPFPTSEPTRPVIQCPTLTPLPANASDEDTKRHKNVYCDSDSGTWRQFHNFDRPTIFATRHPQYYPTNNNLHFTPDWPNPRVRKVTLETIVFFLVVITFIIKWVSKFLSAFFDYLSRFADYILNLLRKQDD